MLCPGSGGAGHIAGLWGWASALLIAVVCEVTRPVVLSAGRLESLVAVGAGGSSADLRVSSKGQRPMVMVTGHECACDSRSRCQCVHKVARADCAHTLRW